MKKTITLFLVSLFLVNISNAQTKRVLFEEWTNASCPPCAASNPTLKAWLNTKGDSVVTIIYRTNFPGFDPMYNFNPSQLNERRNYYPGVNAVPWLKGDANHNPDIWPFTFANFDAAFNSRINVVPPLDITVTDQRISNGDSNRATVTVHIFNDLPGGDYKLRVFALERRIVYATPPGSNGELEFEYVFRRGYPDMTGTTIPTTAGTYQFQFTYHIDATWQDSLMYTAAFVQNDVSPVKDVLNANTAWNNLVSITNTGSQVPEQYFLSQNFPNPFNPVTNIQFAIPNNEHVRLSVYNSLGKEVAVLINENLIAGVYNFSFDATSLSSGVYFYKLESKDFSDVKRMVLVK